MAEVCVPLPDDLERELEESGINMAEVAKEAIISKLIEKQISKSKALQRAMFEALASRSELTEKDAEELAKRVDEGMLKELKERFPEL